MYLYNKSVYRGIEDSCRNPELLIMKAFFPSRAKKKKKKRKAEVDAVAHPGDALLAIL